ncbi:serine/threonine protein kinase [Candidatus Woesearchaeota archaeon]|nr:serine/threonine protein kinase [Candidatus Woesearchaeota archaeon]
MRTDTALKGNDRGNNSPDTVSHCNDYGGNFPAIILENQPQKTLGEKREGSSTESTIGSMPPSDDSTFKLPPYWERQKAGDEWLFSLAKKALENREAEPICLEELLGSGGLGIVARGRTKLLDEAGIPFEGEFAIKIIRPDLIDGIDVALNEGNRRRLLNEDRLTRQLYAALPTHLKPHLVRCFRSGEYGFVREDGAPYNIERGEFSKIQSSDGSCQMIFMRPYTIRYLVLELVKGKNLADAPNVSLGSLLSYINTVCEILNVSHSMGIVHRDIKPSNLLLSGAGTLREGTRRRGDSYSGDSERGDSVAGIIKLSDLGLAFNCNDFRGTKKRPLGSPGTTAPEQADWNQNVKVDPRADIFSLGATVYAMAAGALPYTRQQMEAYAQGSPFPDIPPIKEIDHSIPAALDHVIQAAMRPAREERYPSVRHFQEELLSASKGLNRSEYDMLLPERRW